MVIAASAWMFIHALAASSHLSDARDDISRVRLDLLNGQDPDADLRAAETDAAAANHDTHDFVWSAAAWLPPVKTVRGLTAAIDSLAHSALPGVVEVGPSLQPARLRVAHNRIALAPLNAAAPALARASAAATAARDQVAALPSGWFGVINSARDKVLDQLTSVAGSADDASRFANAGPQMLGEDGTRRYFVGVENNAEARATGGLVAAWAVVTARHGRIKVVARGNDSQLRSTAVPVTSLPADYRGIYGNYLPAQRWATSNLSPNFPAAAAIWAKLWEADTGEHVDGVFGVDPYGLADILAAAGPVHVSDYPGTFTGANLAPFIESGEYRAFSGLGEQSARKNFLSDVAGAVLHRLLSGTGDAHTITAALGYAAGNGDLSLWSARPGEESQILGTPLAGALPTTSGPFVSLSVDSATGTKLDYYLRRTLIYDASGCSGSTRDVTITVTLEDTAPLTGLSPYVRLRGDADDSRELVVEQVPRNTDLIWIHATGGSAFESATLDGRPLLVSEGVEGSHAVFGAQIALDPGKPRTLTLHLQEPVRSGAVATKVQPMAIPQLTVLHAPNCAG